MSNSWCLSWKNLTCDNGYKGGFVTKLTRKDVVLATESAKANNQFLMLGDIGRYWYDKACEQEKYANRDLSVLLSSWVILKIDLFN